jgi:hypothetical protein
VIAPSISPGGQLIDSKIVGSAQCVSPIDPLVDLLIECCPSLAYTVAQSLVTEALDLCADLLLCQAWAETRQRTFPQAVRSAHNRHVGHSYADRRAAQWAAIEHRDGLVSGRTK